MMIKVSAGDKSTLAYNKWRVDLLAVPFIEWSHLYMASDVTRGNVGLFALDVLAVKTLIEGYQCKSGLIYLFKFNYMERVLCIQ